jgi:hypothetical protein
MPIPIRKIVADPSDPYPPLVKKTLVFSAKAQDPEDNFGGNEAGS